MSLPQKNTSSNSEEKLQADVAQVLADLNNPRIILGFLTLFLSDHELSSFAKRVAIFKQLHQARSYSDIQDSLGVSSATISAVAQIRENPLTATLLNIFAVQTWAEKSAKKIRNFFHFS